MRRWLVWVVVALAFAGLCVAGDAFGRAEPTGNYRPPLPGDPLQECSPLPGGAELTLPYVVRSDGEEETDAGERRILQVHWSELALPDAVASVIDSFTGTGATAELAEIDADRASVDLVLSDANPVTITFTVFDQPENPDPIVIGSIDFDLPLTPKQDGARCDYPSTSKRFEDAG